MFSWGGRRSFVAEGSGGVTMVILLAALIVVAARLFGPFEVGKDQASQLEAAQRLIAGEGLTTTNDVLPPSLDIIEAPAAKYLTWWPPGFTLLVAGFLFCGVPLLLSLKIIYAAVALAGWFGWARLAGHLLSEPLQFSAGSVPVHLVLATLLPVFFTPSWSGTDIFLWAALPFLFFLLFHGRTGRGADAYSSAAGLLFGALYCLRFASLFIGLGALLIIVLVNAPDIRRILRSYLVFLLSSAVIILPTVAYLKRYAQAGNALPGAQSISYELPDLFARLDSVLLSLPVISNLIAGMSLYEQAIYKLDFNPLTYIFGICCLLVIILLPLSLSSGAVPERPRENLALALSLLPLSLVIFLVAVSLLTGVEFLSIRRYYEPLALGGVFLIYHLATLRRVHWATRSAARLMVFSFLLYVAVLLPILAFIPGRSSYVVSLVLGYMPAKNTKYVATSLDLSYPSNVIFSCKENSKAQLERLFHENPEALFFVEEYAYFIYDNFHGRNQRTGSLRVFPRPEYWQKAYTSRPVKVVWALNSDTKLDFVPASEQRIIWEDRYEKTKIIMAEFPASYRFAPENSPADHIPPTALSSL